MRIPRAPRTGNTATDNWNDKIYENLMGSVKSIFIPAADAATAHGTHFGKELTAGTSTYIECRLPSHLLEIRAAYLKFIPATTGTFDYTVTITYGADFDDEALNTNTKTADGDLCTDDLIESLDITSAFADIDQEDQIGLKFTVDALGTTTNLNVLGLDLKFF
jgi:hypothetical protein